MVLLVFWEWVFVMQWVLLIAALAGLIMLSRYYPRMALGLFGGLMLALSAAVWFTTDSGDFGRKKLAVASVSLENMVMVSSYAGSYRLSGRLVNRDADVALDEIVLKVLMEDCATGSCEIVGQALERVNLSVPAGQARDFSGSVNMGEPVIRGVVQWRFEVVEVRP